MPNAHPDLWQRYQATKAASTAKYARDIAAEMGISEAELTAARLGHDAVLVLPVYQFQCRLMLLAQLICKFVVRTL